MQTPTPSQLFIFIRLTMRTMAARIAFTPEPLQIWRLGRLAFGNIIVQWIPFVAHAIVFLLTKFLEVFVRVQASVEVEFLALLPFLRLRSREFPSTTATTARIVLGFFFPDTRNGFSVQVVADGYRKGTGQGSRAFDAWKVKLTRHDPKFDLFQNILHIDAVSP